MIKVQIGNTIYEIPEVGNNKWGEKSTQVLLAISEALSNLVGPEDILTREALLGNNVSTRTPVNGLRFDSTVMQSCIVNGVIVRTFPEGLGIEPLKDTFVIEGVAYKGAFDCSIRYTGTGAGVRLYPRDDGQIEYTSENIPNTDVIFIKFKGNAIIDEEQ